MDIKRNQKKSQFTLRTNRKDIYSALAKMKWSTQTDPSFSGDTPWCIRACIRGIMFRSVHHVFRSTSSMMLLLLRGLASFPGSWFLLAFSYCSNLVRLLYKRSRMLKNFNLVKHYLFCLFIITSRPSCSKPQPEIFREVGVIIDLHKWFAWYSSLSDITRPFYKYNITVRCQVSV